MLIAGMKGWNYMFNNIKLPYSKWQFGMFRIIFGSYLFIHFLYSLPFSKDIWRSGGLLALSLLLILGVKRRWVSFVLCFVWAYLFYTHNLMSPPGIQMVACLLLAMSLIPSGEALVYGNLKGNREWKLPKILFFGAWAIVAISHLLYNPLSLEIGVVILCIFRKTRFYAWLASLGIHFGILSLVNVPDLTFGVIMIHLFIIDPTWFIKDSKNQEKIVFFDGLCGVCNGWVDVLLDIDFNGQLHFSPLQSEKAKKILSSDDFNVDNVDSIIYYKEGQIYSKSSAVLEILKDMGGLWSMSIIFRIVPPFIRDFGYDIFAKYRYAMFGKNKACRMPSVEEKE
jgi:predicted DCC family thiol-disulfide oxidoreductase YuxK